MEERPSIDEMWALLQEQRAEIARLKEQLAMHEGEADVSAMEEPARPRKRARRFSRAGLLKVAAAGVAGVAGVAMLQPESASASTVDDSFEASGSGASGFYTTGFPEYGVSATGTNAGVSGAGPTGVFGTSTKVFFGGGFGVDGLCASPDGTGYGVRGWSRYNNQNQDPGIGFGVYGGSGAGIGVAGLATDGTGVQGTSNGILQKGVEGICASATGQGYGVFGSIKDSNSNLGIGYGVYGEAGAGGGVGGLATDGTGVQGISNGNSKKGVEGMCASADGTGYGVYGSSQDSNNHLAAGVGVYGEAGSGNGVSGSSQTGIGVSGQSGSIGVQGASSGSQQTGVYGIQTANDGTGVVGRSFKDNSRSSLGAGTGVWGDSSAGPGLKGTSVSGRGGVFTGGAAQIHLAPSTASTHPITGQAGDLFVDKSKRLWFCQGGKQWKQLA